MSEGSPHVRPGPVSAAIDWADGLPGGGWWVFVLLAAALLAWGQGIEWATGVEPVGTFDPQLLIGVPYGPFGFICLGLGLRIARSSLQAFWPATGWPDAERAAWERRFALTPFWPEVSALALGAVGAVGALVGLVGGGARSAPDATVIVIAYLPAYLAGYGIAAAGGLIAIRWLRHVARIHREATAVDVFDRGPIYAFSRLTVVVGLTYLAVAYYSVTVNAGAQVGNPASLAFIGFSMLFAIASFVLPLWGIHGRLEREKNALRREVDHRINALAGEVYARIDARQFDEIAVINTSIAGVNALRDRIEALPTWPWPPQVLRGFVSALLIPVIVYVATRLIGGGLGS